MTVSQSRSSGWETIYLGILSERTTTQSHGHPLSVLRRAMGENLDSRISAIKALIGDRQLIYMGSRHAHWENTAEFNERALRAGATDVCNGTNGTGTIPHALENIMAWKFSTDRAVVESLCAFDRHIDAWVPRIALVDYRNREIQDLTECDLTGIVDGIRVDTCGENVMEGGWGACEARVDKDGIWCEDIKVPFEHAQYWFGTGVTISGVWKMHYNLPANVKVILSSGFGKLEKVKAFVHAEEILEMKLFDGLGVGDVFGIVGYRMATMDITHVGEGFESLKPCSKKGRVPIENPNLVRRI